MNISIPDIISRLMLLAVATATALMSTGCHPLEEWDNNPQGNFEALWTILDEHYCFFAEKEVDWREIHDEYAAKISNRMTSKELFFVCADMLNELRDGHTNLSASFNTSYYRKWWSDYPQNYSERLVEQYYLNFNFLTASGLDYAVLPQNIGYIRYSSFSTSIGEGNLDEVLMYLNTCDGLIIDIRDNGGGAMTNVETLVRRFITSRTLAGYISHKTGPGHNDFSEPYAYYFDPAEHGRVMWGKPTVVLTSRGTFSAANNFVSIMKYIPGVTIAGSRTGGGSGMPFNSELPNGWSVRFSACSVLDCYGQTTEFGIDPTPGCEVDLDPQQALLGHDTILDFAIARLTSSCSQE
ncbi:S41 family peptidase [Muribaculum sp.]|uniref:S41 family peptidase n=1 Tax=Muribaculum sp. TaxID=1918611 RepID=UPI0023CF7BA9|nr:S41 family peptidase [Muribaculum sp.]MDE5704627.1 S41 family peptidase [Muribaculum sp.]MDE5923568.1 S41 family peptidase [Muribaculum sp.]